MTKEEKIKEAWAYFGGEVDDNGWRLIQSKFINEVKNIEISGCGKYYRPKSLKGIEDNNGWSYIPSIHDKEIEKGQYWIMYPNGFIEVAYYDGTMECYKFWKLNFTHYQIIEKPKPPLY